MSFGALTLVDAGCCEWLAASRCHFAEEIATFWKWSLKNKDPAMRALLWPWISASLLKNMIVTSGDPVAW